MKIGKWIIIKDRSDEAISSRTFNLAKVLNGMIDLKSDQASARNKLLEGKIMEWYTKTKDDNFADFMGIKKASGI